MQTLDWIVRRSCQRSDLAAALRGELDAGEAEADALLLIDERDGRRAATRLGLQRLGLVGVLVEAKQRDHITEVRPLLRALREEAGFRISDALHDRVLTAVGE